MDTHRLKYFVRIAEEGSITRAASVLGIAQPALSRQIRLLEEDLGVTLFRRTRRGVQLTEEGDRLRAATSGPLRQLELALRYAGSPMARLERELFLGLPPTAAAVLAAPLLRSLSANFPKVNFQITAANTDQLVEAMLKGAIDVAMITPVPDDRLFYRDLLVEDLFVVGGSGTDLTPGRAVTFTELVGLPLVLPSSHTGIGNSIENAAMRRKVAVRSRFGTDSLDVAKSLIEAGIGYGVLPLSACGNDIQSGRLRYAPLTDPTLTQQLGIAATAQLDLPRQLGARIGIIIRDEVERLINSGTWTARFTSPAPWDPSHG